MIRALAAAAAGPLVMLVAAGPLVMLVALGVAVGADALERGEARR